MKPKYRCIVQAFLPGRGDELLANFGVRAVFIDLDPACKQIGPDALVTVERFQAILTEHMPDWREVEAMINGPR